MNILHESNSFKSKKNVEYYNYYEFHYLFITCSILKANNFNYILIDIIGNIDIYIIELSRKEKFLLKAF